MRTELNGENKKLLKRDTEQNWEICWSGARSWKKRKRRKTSGFGTGTPDSANMPTSLPLSHQTSEQSNWRREDFWVSPPQGCHWTVMGRAWNRTAPTRAHTQSTSTQGILAAWAFPCFLSVFYAGPRLWGWQHPYSGGWFSLKPSGMYFTDLLSTSHSSWQQRLLV